MSDKIDKLIEIGDKLNTPVRFLKNFVPDEQRHSIDRKVKERCKELGGQLEAIRRQIQRIQIPEDMENTIRIFAEIIKYVENERDLGYFKHGYGGNMLDDGRGATPPPPAPDGRGTYFASAVINLREAADLLIEVAAIQQSARSELRRILTELAPISSIKIKPDESEKSTDANLHQYALIRNGLKADSERFDHLQRIYQFDRQKGDQCFKSLQASFNRLTGLTDKSNVKSILTELHDAYEELRSYLYILNLAQYNTDSIGLTEKKRDDHLRAKELRAKFGKGELNSDEQIELSNKWSALSFGDEMAAYHFGDGSKSMEEAIQNINPAHVIAANKKWKR